MKKWLPAAFACLIGVPPALAQNLVLNPGLDGIITCPGFGQFSNAYILNWNKPSIASSDYYNWNCPGIQPTLQAPRNGEGYAGIIAYNYGGTEYREYITGTFSSPLVAGTNYHVEFYVSLHDNYIQAIEEVGAYISQLAPGPFSNVLHINVTPQIENGSGALQDTAGWKKISGQYLATGGEMYITIGNFHDDAGTTITQPGSVGSYGAYYFVDDVSVVADSTTSMAEGVLAADQPMITYADEYLHVILTGGTGWTYPVEVREMNVYGGVLSTTVMHSGRMMVPVHTRASGLYLVAITDASGRRFTGKVLKR